MIRTRFRFRIVRITAHCASAVRVALLTKVSTVTHQIYREKSLDFLEYVSK